MKYFSTILKTNLMLFMMLCSMISTAQSDQYLHFDRQNDYVLTPNASAYIANAPAFSMSGWFYTDELAYGQGMMGFRDGVQGFYLIQLDNGIIECRLRNSAGTLYEFVAPALSIIPQTWQHVSWVYTGTEVQLFIDANMVGSTPASGVITTQNIGFAIGRSILADLNFYFGGRVDEVSLWSKALTATDIEDMMMNELNGDEADLELYYKFNQGFPGEDNTTITSLTCEVGDGERDGDLLNFALTGEESNFNGDLDVGFQSISFPGIPDKLTTDVPFNIMAESSSGLAVTYAIVEGPASIAGNTITLDGVTGTVKVSANQGGDGTFDPAEEVVNTFEVLDPQTFVPVIDVLSPLAGDFFVPELTPIRLAATATIDFPDLFSVDGLYFEIDGTQIPAIDYGNGHYSAWWTPSAYGAYAVNVFATNNFGADAITTINFTVVDSNPTQTKNPFTNVWLNTANTSEIIEAELPCSQGAFESITATLNITCPSGGCGEWDRVANVEVKGYNGEWINLIRYITPYGVACSHEFDLTDFASVLHGKVEFRPSCVTFDNGYNWSLELSYNSGSPSAMYSNVVPMWQGVYPFGDMADLQPIECVTVDMPNGITDSKFKVISTGHGWGNNNTDNAAEFSNNTHHIWVNDQETFTQQNWQTCNPNPDACQPQFGTWGNARAGWCPGAVASWFDYDLQPSFNSGPMQFDYIFDESYADLCHPNNPNCITNANCDCADGFNPELHVASSVIIFSDSPINDPAKSLCAVSADELTIENHNVALFPNPNNGEFSLLVNEELDQLQVSVYNYLGQTIQRFSISNVNHETYQLNLKEQAKGIYFVVLESEKGKTTRSVVIE